MGRNHVKKCVNQFSRTQPVKNGKVEFTLSEKFKLKVGEELYKSILALGLKPEEFDLVNDGAYIPRARLNEVSGKLKATEDKVLAHEKQLEETKVMLKGSEEFKTKYDDLITKHQVDIAAKDKEIVNTSKKFLVEQYLRESGAKHTSLLMKEVDLDSLSIDNDKLLGLDKMAEKLKTDYSDLFVVTKTNNSTKQSDKSDKNNNEDEEDWTALLKDM